MKLELGAVGVFKGTATFHENSIISTLTLISTDPLVYNKIKRKGGVIHNKEDLTFEKDAVFTDNLDDRVEYGSKPGGAISNHVKRTVTFVGNLTMIDNTAVVDFYRGAEGGAFFNRGDVFVHGEAEFIDNYGGTYGGGIANFGGDFVFEAGSSWVDQIGDNSCDGGIGGAIYNENGGVVTLKGPTEFKRNYALWGDAIANRIVPSEYSEDYIVDSYKLPNISYPNDTIFENKGGVVSQDKS